MCAGKKRLLYNLSLRYMMGLSRELSKGDLKQIGGCRGEAERPGK